LKYSNPKHSDTHDINSEMLTSNISWQMEG